MAVDDAAFVTIVMLSPAAIVGACPQPPAFVAIAVAALHAKVAPWDCPEGMVYGVKLTVEPVLIQLSTAEFVCPSSPVVYVTGWKNCPVVIAEVEIRVFVPLVPIVAAYVTIGTVASNSTASDVIVDATPVQINPSPWPAVKMTLSPIFPGVPPGVPRRR